MDNPPTTDAVADETGRKRLNSVDSVSSNETPRPRLRLNKEKDHRNPHSVGKQKERWITHRKIEDYTNLVGDIMYPKAQFGPMGYNPVDKRFPIENVNSLGYLLSPLRRPTVLEKWNPYEVALFEASITLYGKRFDEIQKIIQTKSTKDIIEFYYDWKKTSHYKQWKEQYIPDERDLPPVQKEC